MMGMLGGRLGAYRDGLAAGDLKPALVRNLYRGGVARRPRRWRMSSANCWRCARRWRRADVDRLIAGDLP